MDNPIQWLRIALICVASFGVFLGALSFISPERSIRIYQSMMAFFNWRVEPINWKQELLTTKILGVAIVVLSLTIFAVISCLGCCPLR